MATASPSAISRTPVRPIQPEQAAPSVETPHSPPILTPSEAYRAFEAAHPQFVEEIRRLRAYKTFVLARLAAMPRREQRSEVRRLLHSSRLATLYAYKAVLKAGLIADATPASIAAIAAKCNPFALCLEAVERLSIVRGGKVREVQKFGPIKRMMQALVADIIRALHPTHGSQYVFHGGIPAALRAVEAAYRRGMTHAVEVDAVDFYGSVPKASLADLLRPLPDAVVRHVVWDESIRRATMEPPTTIRIARLRPPALNETSGLSLGAASSPVVGELIIRKLLADAGTASDVEVITYADNLLVLGRSEQDATARAAQLAALAETSSGGSLRFRERGQSRLPSPGEYHGTFSSLITFVGQIGSIGPDDQFSWSPDPDKLAEHAIAETSPSLTIAEIEKAERQLAAWRRAYPFWREGDLWEARHRAALACARYMRQAGFENFIAARNALVWAVDASGACAVFAEFIPDFGERHAASRRRLIEAAEAYHANRQRAARTASH